MKELTMQRLLKALAKIEDRANAKCLEISNAADSDWLIAAAVSQVCQELAAELVSE